MKTSLKLIAGLSSAFALVASAVSAAPMSKKMTEQSLDEVVAGSVYCDDKTKLKGNNGWGNGSDPSNPGSASGKTAPSKTANLSVAGAGKVNINPTTSTGR